MKEKSVRKMIEPGKDTMKNRRNKEAMQQNKQWKKEEQKKKTL